MFSERCEQLLVGIAAQAAIGIDNARLYEDVRKAAEERRHLLEAERAARTESERASLMKDEFLATLSHELRTPLSAILGWSQMLAMGGYSPEDLAEGLESISRNAHAQTRLIDDLLDMNRIVSGKVRLDVQTADLASVIDAAVNAVRPSIDAKGIRLRKILDPLAGPVLGDPTRLQQIVWNLLTNAVKFTPKEGKIDVLLERVNSHIEITVSDSGEGIAPQFLPHVFERFRQSDSSLTRRHGGLGLGLAIVKQLDELHGGTVRAKSAGEGQGATFVITLPIAPIREANERREHPTAGLTASWNWRDVHLEGIKVLVVDDEPDARNLVKRLLLTCGAEVATAESAAQALAQLSSQRPQVIVSDIGMPEIDGYHFMREVRQLSAESGGKTPAVALTAFARSEDRTRAMMAGYNVHIAKPIEPHELIATVASLVGRTGSGGK
jgi:signal transduction histidine kinase/CheY-like chemotaxis protein